MCHFCQKWNKNKNWSKLFSTDSGTFPIDLKLAETAPLLYRATDVPFLPKLNKNQVTETEERWWKTRNMADGRNQIKQGGV